MGNFDHIVLHDSAMSGKPIHHLRSCEDSRRDEMKRDGVCQVDGSKKLC